MIRFRVRCALLVASGAALFFLPGMARAASALESLFNERARSVVAVEFFVATEIDRRPSTVVGLVADDHGLVVLLDSAIPGWLPPAQLKDFRVYAPGSRDGVPAEYLGQDYLTGWHFIRVGENLRAQLAPCTSYGTAVPSLGDEVWGIGLMGKDLDFQPFLMSGRVAVVQRLPQQVGFSVQDLGSPGAPVFAASGELVGWAGNAVPQERLLFLENEHYNVGIQNPNGTGSFFFSAEVLPYLGRVPGAPVGQEIPWLGVIGLQPVDPEVAAFLKLENRSAVVVSDVIKDSPAAAAGIAQRDIIVSIDGAPFARFSPDRVVTAFLEREIMRRKPGEEMRFGIVRGEERREATVTLGKQPKPLKEAERRYFERLGITLREFVLFDSVSRRMNDQDAKGVIANFVKPNSPANTAGLRPGDLIQEIDGQPSADYAQAIQLLDAIEKDESRSEFVLLISRETETQVIRVRLK